MSNMIDDKLDDFENIEIADLSETVDSNYDNDYQKVDANDEIQEDKKFNFIGVRTVRFTHADMLLLILLTFVSFWTHNFMIQFPELPVFDESHFGSFTNGYITGNYFQDIHPPLGKLVLFMFGKLNQYDGKYNFYNHSVNYPSVDYIGLRQCPALFSTFCSPMIFIALRCFGISTFASFTAGLMILCDNSMIVEGRFILTDGILHFFVCLTIMSTGAVIVQSPNTFNWWVALFFNGLALGCSVSTKFTSLSLCPFVGLIHVLHLLEFYPELITDFFHFYKYKDFFYDLIIRAGVLIFMVVVVFFSSFFAHFILLPYGNETWMGRSFSQSLLNPDQNNIDWERRTRDQSLFKNTIKLNIQMHKRNMAILTPHPYSSEWYSWPFLTGKWVLFYSSGAKHIMCMGHVFNVYAGTISVILSFCFLAFSTFSKKFEWQLIINAWLPAAFAFGYCASLLPFALIKRSLFFYHYIISIIFGITTFNVMVDKLLYKHQVIKGVILAYAQIFTCLAFFFWSPWTYGYKMSDFNVRLWNRKWQM